MKRCARYIIGAPDDESHSEITASDVEELKAFGFDVGDRFKPKEEKVQVWYDNVNAIKLFRACHPTLWVYRGMTGLPSGLDYSGMEICREYLGIPRSPELLDQMKYCQLIAMNYWAQQAEQAAQNAKSQS